MDTLIERHPVAFFGFTMMLTLLLATVYVALGEDVISGLSWFAGVPGSTVSVTLAPGLRYLRPASLVGVLNSVKHLIFSCIAN